MRSRSSFFLTRQWSANWRSIFSFHFSVEWSHSVMEVPLGSGVISLGSGGSHSAVEWSHSAVEGLTRQWSANWQVRSRSRFFLTRQWSANWRSMFFPTRQWNIIASFPAFYMHYIFLLCYRTSLFESVLKMFLTVFLKKIIWRQTTLILQNHSFCALTLFFNKGRFHFLIIYYNCIVFAFQKS